MNIAEYLQKEAGFSPETAKQIDDLFDDKSLPKGHQLLKDGSRSKKVFFIEKGLLRLYYVKDGKDITRHFYTEGGIYVPIENVFLNQHYPYNLELLENSIIRTVDYSTLEKRIDEHVKLQHFAHYVAISVIKQLSEHLYSLQFQSALERYNILLKTHPDILLRAPLGHIASYLGITQQTLSVIRSAKS